MTSETEPVKHFPSGVPGRRIEIQTSTTKRVHPAHIYYENKGSQEKVKATVEFWKRRVGVHTAETDSEAAGARGIIEERQEIKGTRLVNSIDAEEEERENDISMTAQGA